MLGGIKSALMIIKFQTLKIAHKKFFSLELFCQSWQERSQNIHVFRLCFLLHEDLAWCSSIQLGWSYVLFGARSVNLEKKKSSCQAATHTVYPQNLSCQSISPDKADFMGCLETLIRHLSTLCGETTVKSSL